MRSLPCVLAAKVRGGARALTVVGFAALLLAGALAGTAAAQPGTITTYAGNGTQGYAGDGDLATLASLTTPFGLAVDAAGNLYIADYDAHVIRKVDAATGIISTFAGNGIQGWLGDGGPATDARITGPLGIAIAPSGDLYFTEYTGSRVRKVDGATGIISTVAGTGVPGYNGDGIPATAAQLNHPWGLAADAAGHLYIADHSNYRIRRIDAATGLISTVAGTGVRSYTGDGGLATAAAMTEPEGIAVDANGNLYVALSFDQVIRKVTAATGIIDRVAGTGAQGFSGDGGLATSAMLFWPYDVRADGAGNLYIADTGNYRVRSVSAATGVISTVAGNGVWGYSGDGGPAVLAAMRDPVSVAVNATGDVYISDPYNYRVRRVEGKATPALTWAVPAAVPSGTVLGAAQLNATANVPGTFVYDPPAGTVVLATTQLFVTFTPNDAANYNTAMADVQLTVTTGPVNGPPYTLTVTLPEGGKVAGAGINCGAGGTQCTVTMPAAMTIGLSATASTGYTFTGWTGDCTGTSPGVWVQLNGPRTCGAAFAPPAPVYTLTIAPKPTGGTVAGSGLTCGTGGTTCAVTFGGETTASLLATADAGYTFTIWGGACAGADAATTVEVDAERVCTATFTPLGGVPVNGPPYTLTISPAPTGGTVTGAGINCGAGGTKCAVTMPAPMTLGMTATASDGYTFTAWTGDCTGTAAGLWLSLAGPRTCGATFTSSGGGGTPEGGIIETVAGAGDGGYGGDGGLATETAITPPRDVAIDGAGNLYIADPTLHAVRKVEAATGIITTVAGTGAPGYNGDGIAATSASLNLPYSVAADAGGNLYIADYSNSRVRRVDAATGIITTVAGTGTAGFSGDLGPATEANLDGPYQVALDDAGNLFITDSNNFRVRRVDAATGIITTYAGMGMAGYGGDGGLAIDAPIRPAGLALDASGNLFLAESDNKRVRKVTAATGIITTVAGTGIAGDSGDGGLATAATLNNPVDVAVDAAGNLYIADSFNFRVRRVAAATGIMTTYAGTGVEGFSGDGGPATEAQISYPYGLDFDSAGQLYIADNFNLRVRRVTAGPVAPVDGPPYTLTVTPPDGGKIRGAGINCGAGGTACSVTMPAPMTLGLEAVASAGYAFTAWTGDCTGTSPGLWLPLTGSRACSASFTPVR